MKIVIKTKNIRLTPILEKYIEKKLNSLEKFTKTPPPFSRKESNSVPESQTKKYIGTSSKSFYKKGGGARVEAWIEIGKESLHHQKGKVFRAECQMRLPGKSLRSEAVSKNLRQAITEVKDELQRELKQYKGKIASLAKRRARVLKKSLRLSPQARFWRKGRIREEGI